MSSWQEFSGGRRLGNTPPVKCSVAQTCNRLSRYLRERGSLRDLGPEIAGKLEVKGRPEGSHLTPPPNFLFGRMDNPTEESAKQGLMDLFPQHADDAGVNSTIEDATDKALSSKQRRMEIEPKTAAMTIFYGDQVFVFDNFPADKVGDLIGLTNGEKSVPYKPHSKAFGSDLPIARRASLHRFMDKRKDRVIARAPYPAHGSPSASSTKQEEQLALKL